MNEYINVIIREADNYNITHEPEGNIVRIISFGHDAPSGISYTPQGVVDESIAGDYDVYIGLMGCRFGTETKQYKSGTHKECMDAIEKHKAGALMHVAFFFYRGRIDSLNEIDSEQLSLVNKFRLELSEVKDRAVLYRDFSDEAELCRLFHTTIASAIKSMRLNEVKVPMTTTASKGQRVDQLTQPDAEEMGLYEHVQMGLDDMEEARHAINDMTTYINEYQAILEKETESIKQYGADAKIPQNVKMRTMAKTADKIGDQMIILASRMEPKAKYYRDKSSSAFNHILEAITIGSSISENGSEGRTKMRDALVANLESMTVTKESLEGFLKATDAMPNYTTIITRGRKMLSKALHCVDQSIASCQSQARDLIQLLND